VLILDRLLRFERSALVLIEPIFLLTDPGQLPGSHAQAPPRRPPYQCQPACRPYQLL